MQQHPTLLEVPDSLQLLYKELHPEGNAKAVDLVSQPNVSLIEWSAFQNLVRKAAEKRLLIVSGVTSTGATKQSRRAANLLAGDDQRVLPIDCAPQFDLEYHKKYIGHDDEKGVFQPGELLRFWQECHKHPKLKYAVVIDNFDKINPETFFGPAIWEALSSRKPATILGRDSVILPRNCYMISVTHLGPGAYYEFNEEHFKRLGPQFNLQPNPRELVAWLRQQPGQEKKPERIAALRDPAQLQRFVYSFMKTNEMLTKKYGEGYQLGQGSNLRPLFADSDQFEFKQTVLNHINAFKPGNPLQWDDFQAIDYALENNGKAWHSSIFARQLQWLDDTGYLVEVTMVGATALLTALIGWFVFRRRERIIRTYGQRARDVFDQFENQELSAEVTARELEKIKHEVDALVLNRRLGYTEGLYFLAFIEDRVKRVEFAKNISENFLELFNAFMEDNILTEGEYLKLRQFLQSIRHKIPDEAYDDFSNKVENAYQENKVKI